MKEIIDELDKIDPQLSYLFLQHLLAGLRLNAEYQGRQMPQAIQNILDRVRAERERLSKEVDHTENDE